MKNLLIVESPAKAKTIAKYLGKDYQVIASFGHIRDLPSKEGSVDPNKDFYMDYEISAKSQKHVSEIISKAKLAENIMLAPDPDREGESIAWHIYEILKQKKVINSSSKVQRVVFNSITKNAVNEAIKKPREIDLDLVNAQQARRALDYLVGFNLSPVLWRKLPGSRSAGRVQSVALRLICDREDEIDSFITKEYWNIKLNLSKQNKQNFEATIFEINDKKLEKFSIVNNIQANEIKESLMQKQYQILSINKKETKRHPYPPFITSSLQQESARKLGFSASKTMMIAQKLYEGIEINGTSQGLITYMRTDSIDLTAEAIDLVRNVITKNYGADFIPKVPNSFKSKVKNAQEAHEAIRPTDFAMDPEKIKNFLDDNQFALYNLIWKRTLASQMTDAIFDQVIIEIQTLPKFAKAKAVGSTIKFEGFYKVYREDVDDAEDNEDESKTIPNLEVNENLNLIEVMPIQHFTEPPPRYSEASLVKKMEELGIGRPSTYATIISVLQDREYVRIDKKRFFPEERGRIVTTFLKEFFMKYVEFDYTAGLEDELDIISNGKMDWKMFLKKFWQSFYANVNNVMDKPFVDVLEVLNQKFGEHIFGRNEDGTLKNKCSSCNEGFMSLRIGKFGSFIGCSNYPTCKNTMKLFDGESGEHNENESKPQFQPKNIGVDPKSGHEIVIKIGPYGPYIELIGSEIESNLENKNDEVKDTKKKSKKTSKTAKKTSDKKTKKPKRVAIPKSIDPNNIDLQKALDLLSLPRDVGTHPETGLKIVANIGPFGPYLLHNKKFTSVKEDDILEIGLNRAIDIISSALERQSKKPQPKKKK